MNTCGTCKYRGKEHPVYAYSYDYANENKLYRTDGKPVELDENGCEKPTSVFFLCDRIRMKEEYDRSVSKEKAFCVDGSGYYAALCVDSDFGCNLWEAA